jgi:uncharacterized protein (TIGR02246 family)
VVRTVISVVACAIGFGVAVLGQPRLGTPADEAAILKNRDAQNAAFNKHDAKAYAALSSDDIDRIDALGTVSGRANLERRYAERWKADPSATVRDESRKIRFVSNDVAILDVDNIITRSSGTNRNHATFVYAKRNGEWTSVAQRVIAKP